MSLVVPDTPSKPDRSFRSVSRSRAPHPVMVHEVHEDAGIEVAGAGSHHEAARRREPHRRVDRPPVLDRGHARAVAEMRDHGAPERRRAERFDDVLVRQAMEAVAADACVERVRAAARGAGDLRQARGGTPCRSTPPAGARGTVRGASQHARARAGRWSGANATERRRVDARSVVRRRAQARCARAAVDEPMADRRRAGSEARPSVSSAACKA